MSNKKKKSVKKKIPHRALAVVTDEDREKPARKGRAPGTKLDPTWELTYKQMHIAEKLVDFTTDSEVQPITSVMHLAREIDEDHTYIRKLMQNPKWQKYLWHLMDSERPILEHLFARGLAFGLMVSDPAIMRLYAQVTGKMHKEKKDSGLTIKIVAPDGTEVTPSVTVDDDHDIIDVTPDEDGVLIVGPDDDGEAA